jgi:hypothetical protein
MGTAYAWASPDKILDLTEPQLTMYLERIPERDYEREVGVAQLTALVAGIGREKNELSAKDFLGRYARAHAESLKPDRYTPRVRSALRFAAANKLLPQRAIDLVEWESI